MSDRSANGVVGVTFGLILLLLLLVGGVGFYYMHARQQMALAAEVAKAHASETLALQVELERTEAVRIAEQQKARGGELEDVDADAIRAAVESVLRAQEEAWNRGDVDTFMEHYWKSDDLTFSSGGKTTRGWNATLARYRERYPTPEEMGRLTLNGLEITPLGDSAALVLGQWKVDRESEPVGGNFSLVFRKIGGRWVVVHDHTSRVEE